MADTTEIETLDTARILNQDENEWDAGYLTVYRRVKTIKFFASKVFDDSLSVFTSESFLVVPYSKFRLYTYLIVTAAPTDIVVEIEFSYNGSTWYKFMNGPFGDLRWASSAGDKKECIDGNVNSYYMRLKATATGVNATDKFILSARADLASS